jgi:hypothetical protein
MADNDLQQYNLTPEEIEAQLTAMKPQAAPGAPVYGMPPPGGGMAPSQQAAPTGTGIGTPMSALIGGAGGAAAAPMQPRYEDLPTFSKAGMNAPIPAGFPSAGGTLKGLYDEANKSENFDKVKELLGKIDLAKSANRTPEPIRPGDQLPMGTNYTPEQMDSYLRQAHSTDDARLKESFAQGERETGTKGVRDQDFFVNHAILNTPANLDQARAAQYGAAQSQQQQGLKQSALSTELEKQKLINQNTLDMHKLQTDLLDKRQEEEDANTHAKASTALFISELKKAQESPDPETRANALKIATQQQATFNAKAGRDAQGKKIVPASGKAQTPAGDSGPEALKTQATSDVSRLFPLVGPSNPEGLAQMLQSASYSDPESRKALIDELKSRPNWPQIDDSIHNHLGVKMMNAHYNPDISNRAEPNNPKLNGFEVAPPDTTGNLARNLFGLQKNRLTTPYGKTVDVTGADNKAFRMLPGKDYENREKEKAVALAGFLRESRGLPQSE